MGEIAKSPVHMEEDSLVLEDGGMEDFEVTLRIHDNELNPLTPEPGGGGVPRIGVTPMSDDDRHSTVSLTSTPGGSPMFQPRGVGDLLLRDTNELLIGNNKWKERTESPLPPHNEQEAKEFFAYRDSLMDHVISEVHGELDGEIKGTWLLTEIDFWNHEYERVVVLCQKVLVIVKYDFIGMKIEDVRRLDLGMIDKVIQGELCYPQNSLTPKLHGIAGGVAGVIKDSVIPTVYGTAQTIGTVVWRKGRCGSTEEGVEATEEISEPKPSELANGEDNQGNCSPKRSIKGTIMSALSLEKFEPKTRKSQGIQIIWNEHEPLRFHQKWNPFDRTIPRLTFTSHPLFWHKGGGGSVALFDVDPFIRDLIMALGQGAGDLSPCCRVEYKPIVVESYVGITSLLHNSNALGFYKIRGKVSF